MLSGVDSGGARLGIVPSCMSPRDGLGFGPSHFRCGRDSRQCGFPGVVCSVASVAWWRPCKTLNLWRPLGFLYSLRAGMASVAFGRVADCMVLPAALACWRSAWPRLPPRSWRLVGGSGLRGSLFLAPHTNFWASGTLWRAIGGELAHWRETMSNQNKPPNFGKFWGFLV